MKKKFYNLAWVQDNMPVCVDGYTFLSYFYGSNMYTQSIYILSKKKKNP